MSQSRHQNPSSQSLEGLTSLLFEQPSDSRTRRIPPLEKWSPAHCGDMDLTIKANGEWWHEGRKMTRQSMIDLFSNVLWSEQDSTGKIAYFLKTPIEKIKIQVEDVPLLITQVDSLEKNGKTYLEFTTPHGDKVIADDQHPIIFNKPANTQHTSNTTSQLEMQQPYILVRQNGDSKLYGLLHRNVFFHLVNMGELAEIVTESGVQTQLTLKSGDSVFNLTMPNE